VIVILLPISAKHSIISIMRTLHIAYVRILAVLNRLATIAGIINIFVFTIMLMEFAVKLQILISFRKLSFSVINTIVFNASIFVYFHT